jgi:metal-responsive CopG/Arc/MetJ family transcriptional regulator
MRHSKKPNRGLPRSSHERQRVQITMTIDREVLRQIDVICEREQRSRSQIMDWAATQFAAKHNKAA